MDAVDTIWTALLILMTVCVCVDSGLTPFSGIQIFQLAEDFLYIAHPLWSVWVNIFSLNLPLEVFCVFSGQKWSKEWKSSPYLIARLMMVGHVVMKSIVMHDGLTSGTLFDMTNVLNQGILLVLLFSSARSFFTRSNHVKHTEARRRSTAKTTSPTPKPRLAFVRGLY